MDTFALQLSLENLLYDHFKEQFGTAGNDIGQVSRALADTISRDGTLKMIPHKAVCEAILSGPASSDFATLIRRIRELARNYPDKTSNPVPSDEDRETANWGLFLKCFMAFVKHQDLLSVKDLTVCFTADWLTASMRYISPEEVEWCREEAAKNDNLGVMSPNYRNAFSEAAVTLVCRKFLKSTWTNPEKTRALLSARKQDYERYCMRRYGSVPSWDTEDRPSGQFRCRVLKDMTKLKPEDFTART